jgi:hypothetical protein
MAQSKYKDLTTFTIDFDTDTALLKAYNVRVQSTLVVLTIPVVQVKIPR